MACEHCLDLNGKSIVPYFGLAPHIHTANTDTSSLEGWVGYTPIPFDGTKGVYWCAHCGEGKPSDEELVEFCNSVDNDILDIFNNVSSETWVTFVFLLTVTIAILPRTLRYLF